MDCQTFILKRQTVKIRPCWFLNFISNTTTFAFRRQAFLSQLSLSYSSFSLSDLVQHPFRQIFFLLLGFFCFCPCILITKCYLKRVLNTISQLIALFFLTTNPFHNGHPSFLFVLVFVWPNFVRTKKRKLEEMIHQLQVYCLRSILSSIVSLVVN